MEEKTKNVRNPKSVRGKGFYIAMYSSLGGLLVLAIAIGYYNFIGFGGITGETPYVTEMSQEDLWRAEADNLPVGNHWDEPIGGRGPQGGGTPPPVPATPRPSPAATAPPADADPEADAAAARGATPAPSPQPPAQPEGADDEDWDLGERDEIYLGEEIEDDIFNVFDAAESPQNFAYFTEEDSMHWPVLGNILMDFAQDRLVYDITLDQWRTNDNVAIAADHGDAVRAAAGGVVTDILESRQFGQMVVIDHGNGWVTTYSQLDPDTAVSIGDVVSRGQIIGTVGSPSIFGSLLGYHVNFAITQGDAPIDPNILLTTAE